MLSFTEALATWMGMSCILRVQISDAASPVCRFANKYDTRQVLNDEIKRTQFLEEYVFWESQFIQSGVAYDADTAMTYDGSIVDLTSGVLNANRKWSAASKEALHFMTLCHQINNLIEQNVDAQISVI